MHIYVYAPIACINGCILSIRNVTFAPYNLIMHSAAGTARSRDFRGKSMARKYSLFVYNTSKQEQERTIYSDGVINQDFKIGSIRKTFTLMLSGDTSIQFGVDNSVYLKAVYNYDDDSWTSKTDTPNDISFSTAPSAITASSDFTPD